MKKLYFLFAIAVLLNIPARAQLSILLGNWEMTSKTGKLTESWTAAGDSLLGKSYKYNLQGESKLLETVVIKTIDKDKYFCVTGAQEDKTKMVKFKLISFKKNMLIFENKTHDFPQRIYYKKVGENELSAWIEGVVEGKKQEMKYNYKKVEMGNGK